MTNVDIIDDFNSFFEILARSETYPEFSINCVLWGKSHLDSQDFFDNVIHEISISKLPVGYTVPSYVNADIVIRYLRSCFYYHNIPYILDYFKSKTSEENARYLVSNLKSF